MLRYYLSLVFLLLVSSQGLRPFGVQPVTASSGVALVYVTSGTAHTGGADCNVALSVTAGQFAVASVESNTIPNGLSISSTNISAGNWSQVPSGPYTDGTVSISTMWVAKIPSTTTETFDMHVTTTTNFVSCLVAIYSGPTTVAWDQGVAANNNASTTSFTSGTTGTTTQAKETVVGLYAGQSAGLGTWTAGSGFTLRNSDLGQSTNAAIAFEDENVAATGTYQATMTTSSSNSAALIAATLKGN